MSNHKINYKSFAKSLGKYYMEFLETDFKKQRIPKRRINYRDNNNLLIGLNLKKYDRFDKKIRKHISNGLYQNKIISIFGSVKVEPEIYCFPLICATGKKFGESREARKYIGPTMGGESKNISPRVR